MAGMMQFSKYKGFIAYVFFGVCTTLINLLCYNLFYSILGFPNVFATIIAWFFAVLFAFFTNKLWVFSSKSFRASVLVLELFKFFLCRMGTGLLDVGVMWFSVDKMQWNAMLWKFISNIIVIILNYIVSKLLVFVKRENEDEQ